MRHINLLPWREERRRDQQKGFVRRTLFIVAAALAILALAFMQLQTNIAEQQQRNRYLQSQITTLESQIGEVKTLREQRKLMKQRMAAVERLQASRAEIVRIFDALARAVPEGVVLDDLRQEQQGLRISGTAGNNAAVSNFMRHLDESALFHSARLDVIKMEEGGAGKSRQSSFVLRVLTEPVEEGQ